jgi:hypothetical protein
MTIGSRPVDALTFTGDGGGLIYQQPSADGSPRLWYAALREISNPSPLFAGSDPSGRPLGQSGSTDRPSPTGSSIQVWRTTRDGSERLTRQPDLPLAPGRLPAGIAVWADDTRTVRAVDGFGATITDSSAWLLAEKAPAAFSDLFDPRIGIGLSYIRVPIGSSEFTTQDFYTYDDICPSNQGCTDESDFDLERIAAD